MSEQCVAILPYHRCALAPVKRETGANPVRTRHRNWGVEAEISLGNWEDGGCDDL